MKGTKKNTAAMVLSLIHIQMCIRDSYRIVVADSRYPRDGRFIEEIGYYDPTKEPSVVKVDAEKVQKWIANGAQPTDTVKKLLKNVAE